MLCCVVGVASRIAVVGASFGSCVCCNVGTRQGGGDVVGSCCCVVKALLVSFVSQGMFDVLLTYTITPKTIATSHSGCDVFT